MPPIPEAVQLGEPVQIITTTDDHSFELNHEVLNALLLNDNVRDKKVCVVSVAGAFRKGKSFLLGFMLRFLNKQGSTDWLGSEDQPLAGFSWRGGYTRETTGIWAWSKVFLCPGPDGEEVAVILMDTQGVYDSKSTVKECVTVFALSTMVSSVQVYNLSQNIQEDDLQHLQFFIEYGRLAMEKEDCGAIPFQSLMFLVRDWSFPYDYAFGESGGSKLLDKVLYDSADHQELLDVRHHISSCFKKLGCFLMPHPGDDVACNPKFDGRLADISKKFKAHLKELAPLLLLKENLIVKEVNGTEVTCEALLEYFKVYIDMYKGDKLPEPMTVLKATTKATNLAAVTSAKDIYINGMDQVCGRDMPYLRPEAFKMKHNEMEKNAIDHFNKRKMGDSQQHEDTLLAEIKYRYEGYFKATARAINLAAVQSVKRIYSNGMDQVCGDDKPYLSPEAFEQEHNTMRTKAIDEFNICKMGDKEHSQPHMDQLLAEIKNRYERYFRANARDNNSAAVAIATDIYTNGLEQACRDGQPYLSQDAFEEKHNEMMRNAIGHFTSRTMGGEEHSQTHKHNLLRQINDCYERYFRTTATANNSGAVESAKELYIRGMDQVCGYFKIHPKPADFEEKHNEMRRNAIHHFNTLKMGGTEHNQSHEDRLLAEIEEWYFKASANFTNFAAAVSARDTYKKGMYEVCGDGIEYLRPESAFKEKHSEMWTSAIKHFNSLKIGGEQHSKTHRCKLEADIKTLQKEYFKKNAKTSNLAAVESATRIYTNGMNEVCGDGIRYLRPKSIFQKKHNEMWTSAINHFNSLKMEGEEHCQSHEKQLSSDIETLNEEYFKANAMASNLAAVTSAKDIYTKGMNEVCGDGIRYLRPKSTFQKKHNEIRTSAINHFNSLKMGGEEHSQSHEKQLSSDIKTLNEEYFKANARPSNFAAAYSATEIYITGMWEATGYGKKFLREKVFTKKHDEMRTKAIDHFDNKKMEDSQPYNMELVAEISKKHDILLENNAFNKKILGCKIAGTVCAGAVGLLVICGIDSQERKFKRPTPYKLSTP